MSQVNKEFVSSPINKKLDKTWDGVFQELTLSRNLALGKILTIMDAVIVDPTQNKSVKSLIRNVIWEDNDRELNMARWFLWFNDVVDIKDSDNDQNVPMKYEGHSVAGLTHYCSKFI